MYLKELKKGNIFSFSSGKNKHHRYLVAAVQNEPGKHALHYYTLDKTNAPGKKSVVDLSISNFEEVELVR